MSEARLGVDVKAAFIAAVVLVVVTTLIDSGPLGWLVAPVVLLLLIYAMCKAPARSSLLVLTFFALTLENPSEMPAAGAWRSPFWSFGSIMLVRIKRQTGVSALFLSGMDIMFGVLILVLLYRRATRARLDGQPSLPTPRPLISLAYLSLAGTLYVFLSGVLRGGDSSIALTQMDRVFYLPVVFLLFQAGLRGPRDYAALVKVVVVAAAVRACQAAYVQSVANFGVDPYTGLIMPLPYGTTHHDSMLFAWATVMLLALVLHRIPNGWKALLLFQPILIYGMIENGRRMVWVQIIIVFFILYFVMPPNRLERKIRKGLILSSPLAAAYIIAGWNSAAGVFKPVKTIRSAVDSEVDASTLWRDIENFNLVATLRENPVLGTGYGHGFIEFIPLPPVDYALERFVPHNSILGLWAYCGYFGYTAMTLLWVAGIYFAIRAYNFATDPAQKAAALVALAAVPIYYLQCYGDMGLGSWTGVFMMGAGLAMAGQLAVAAGTWPSAHPKKHRPAPARAAAPTSPPGW
jgi:hypothetical protein